jgi:hypothetical protein
MLFEPQDPFKCEQPKGPVEKSGCLKAMYTVFVILLIIGGMIGGCWCIYNRIIEPILKAASM